MASTLEHTVNYPFSAERLWTVVSTEQYWHDLLEAIGHGGLDTFALDGDTGTGSGRSIPAFDLLGGLEASSAHLLRHGGHRAAAGCTIARTEVDAFRAAFTAHAAAVLTAEDLVPLERVGSRGRSQRSQELHSGVLHQGLISRSAMRPSSRSSSRAQCAASAGFQAEFAAP